MRVVTFGVQRGGGKDLYRSGEQMAIPRSIKLSTNRLNHAFGADYNSKPRR